MKEKYTITKNGVEITDSMVKFEPVSEITPHTYRTAYKKIEEMLKGGKDNPCVYDDIEFAMLDLVEMWENPTRFYCFLDYSLNVINHIIMSITVMSINVHGI